MKKLVASFLVFIALVFLFSTYIFASEMDRFTIKWLDKQYYDFYHFENGYAKVFVDETHNYSLISKDGEEIVLPENTSYASEQGITDGLIIARKDGKCGVIDLKGNIIIPFIYDIIHGFSEGITGVTKNTNDGYIYSGFIDKTGNEILPIVHDRVGDFSDGMGVIHKYGVYKHNYFAPAYGYVDKTGKVIVPKYEYGTDFSEGLAIVTRDGKHYIIDKLGIELYQVEGSYNTVSPFKHGLSIVMKGLSDYIYKHALIDTTGKEVVPLIYDDIKIFDSGYIMVENSYPKEDGFLRFEKGIIDKTGKIIVPQIYEEIRDFKDGLAAVKKDDKYGYVNEKGDLVIPLKYTYAYDFKDGLAIVLNNSKYGVIDTAGKIVLPTEYEMTDHANEGMVVYSTHTRKVIFGGEEMTWPGGLYGYADKVGNIVTPDIYGYSTRFTNGIAVVAQGKWGKCGIIDTEGNEVFPFKYDFIGKFNDGIAWIKHENRLGLIYDNNVILRRNN